MGVRCLDRLDTAMDGVEPHLVLYAKWWSVYQIQIAQIVLMVHCFIATVSYCMGILSHSSFIFVFISTLLLSGCCHKRGTISWSTLLEFIALTVIRWCLPDATFLCYFTSKFILSTCVFVCSGAQLSQQKGLLRFLYVRGPQSMWRQAGLVVPRLHDEDMVADQPRDDRLNPAPRKLEYNSPYDIQQSCGNNCIAIVAVVGKCHDYALINIYHLSSDRFLSYATLSFLRWPLCAISLITCLLAMACAAGEMEWWAANFIIDIMFMVLSIMDSRNMNMDHSAVSNHNTQRRWVFTCKRFLVDICKFVVQMLIWGVYMRLIHHLALNCMIQLLILIGMCTLVSTVFNHVWAPECTVSFWTFRKVLVANIWNIFPSMLVPTNKEL